MKVKIRKRIALIILFLCMPVIWGKAEAVQAATKTTIVTSKMEISMNEDQKVKLKKKEKGASYSFESGDKNIAMVNEKGKVTGVGFGKTKITVTQERNGKNKKVGTVIVEVKEPKLGEKCTLTPVVSKGEYIYVDDFISNAEKYFILISDSPEKPVNANDYAEDEENVLLYSMYEGNWYGEIYAAEVGTEYIHVWAYDYVKKDFTIYLGYITVRVEESSVLEDFWFEWEELGGWYFYDEHEGLTITEGKIKIPYIRQTPVYYTGDYKVTSSDPSIVSAIIRPVDYYTDIPVAHHSGKLDLILQAKKPGTATIEIEAEGIKREFKVTVREAY